MHSRARLILVIIGESRREDHVVSLGKSSDLFQKGTVLHTPQFLAAFLALLSWRVAPFSVATCCEPPDAILCNFSKAKFPVPDPEAIPARTLTIEPVHISLLRTSSVSCADV